MNNIEAKNFLHTKLFDFGLHVLFIHKIINLNVLITIVIDRRCENHSFDK